MSLTHNSLLKLPCPSAAGSVVILRSFGSPASHWRTRTRTPARTPTACTAQGWSWVGLGRSSGLVVGGSRSDDGGGGGGGGGEGGGGGGGGRGGGRLEGGEGERGVGAEI